MKTWNDYKNHVKQIDETSKTQMEKMEAEAGIISAIISKRQSMKISQRELAKMCNMPQSTIARIESGQVEPKLDTTMKIMEPLGLKLIAVSK